MATHVTKKLLLPWETRAYLGRIGFRVAVGRKGGNFLRQAVVNTPRFSALVVCALILIGEAIEHLLLSSS